MADQALLPRLTVVGSCDETGVNRSDSAVRRRVRLTHRALPVEEKQQALADTKRETFSADPLQAEHLSIEPRKRLLFARRVVENRLENAREFHGATVLNRHREAPTTLTIRVHSRTLAQAS